jgi:hypothetical protein
MTKRHYELFANAAARIENEQKREEFTNRLINVLGADNPRFNEDTFKEWIKRERAGESKKGLRPSRCNK